MRRRTGVGGARLTPMDRSRLVLISLVALVLALGAAFVARGLAAPRPRVVAIAPAAPPKPTLRVLVARHDLNTGDVVGPDSFTWTPWPVEAANPLFITDGAAVVASVGPGAKLEDAAKGAATAVASAVKGGPDPAAALAGSVVRQPILASEPVIASRLVRPGAGGVMAVTLDPGMRAMSVPLTAESAAGGFILPGDHVDVVQTRKDAQEGRPAGPRTATVIRNVRVLAIDQNTHADKGAAVLGATGTLEVTPEEAEFLVLARAQGDLTLVLRSYADAQGPAQIAARPPAVSDGVVHVFRNGQAVDVKVAR